MILLNHFFFVSCSAVFDVYLKRLKGGSGTIWLKNVRGGMIPHKIVKGGTIPLKSVAQYRSKFVQPHRVHILHKIFGCESLQSQKPRKLSNE